MMSHLWLPTPDCKELLKLNMESCLTSVVLCLQTILYSFPAVCWLYGAGFMFSSFASLVFWGQSIARLWELLRAQLTVVQPVGLQV